MKLALKGSADYLEQLSDDFWEDTLRLRYSEEKSDTSLSRYLTSTQSRLIKSFTGERKDTFDLVVNCPFKSSILLNNSILYCAC